MDHLRQGIHLRGYAQQNPKQEYKREAFQMFTHMLDRIKQEFVSILARVEVRAETDVEAVQSQRSAPAAMQFQHEEASSLASAAPGDMPTAQRPITRQGRKVGRNEPCPCGSGKKFKHCHGALAG